MVEDELVIWGGRIRFTPPPSNHFDHLWTPFRGNDYSICGCIRNCNRNEWNPGSSLLSQYIEEFITRRGPIVMRLDPPPPNKCILKLYWRCNFRFRVFRWYLFKVFERILLWDTIQRRETIAGQEDGCRWCI